MIAGDDFSKRRRVAWTVLLSSFTVFAIICVSVPVSVVAYVRNGVQPLLTSVATNRGTVAIAHITGETTALLAADEPRTIEAGAEIITNAADSALLLAYAPNDEQLILRGQLYGNTRIEVDEASTPRFEVSNAPHQLTLQQSHGRLRVAVLSDEEVLLHINTPHGKIEISQAGQYAIDVDNDETQIAVQSGSAKISMIEENNIAQSLLLDGDQRGILRSETKPEGPLSTERNLIKNGDFIADFSSWTVQDWNVELSDQPTGQTSFNRIGGENKLLFSRMGIGHADAGLRQVINQNVADFISLRLILSFQIREQTVGVCGTVGSECPLSVRIEYKDETGANRTWEQGVYANGTVAADTPDICINCSPPYNPHMAVQMGRLQVIDVNLLESLAMQGFSPPQQITSISITAAGHSFETEITKIELLGKE